MERVQWAVNDALLERILIIKESQQRPLKKGFKKWLKYIYNYKQEEIR
jgi:hypothetical protein